MRFVFKTRYEQDLTIWRHGGDLFWYGLLLAVVVAAPLVLDVFYIGELTLVLIYGSYLHFLRAYELGDSSLDIQLPTWPATLAGPFALTVLALRDNVAPPTINLDNPGEGCDLNYVPRVAQERPIRHAVSNSFGFGGTNGSLVFSDLAD